MREIIDLHDFSADLQMLTGGFRSNGSSDCYRDIQWVRKVFRPP